MKKYIIGILLSIFLLSGCVSDTDYESVKGQLTRTQSDLVECRNKECSECICEEETTEEVKELVDEPYFEECPYDCGEYRECKAVYDIEGKIRNWQCVNLPFQ